MKLNVFELREIDELLRDFDHMLWKTDSRAGTSFRLRIHGLLKRLEKVMQEEENTQHMIEKALKQTLRPDDDFDRLNDAEGDGPPSAGEDSDG